MLNVPQGDGTYLADLKSIKVSPDPPKPGQDMTVTVDGTVNEIIEVR